MMYLKLNGETIEGHDYYSHDDYITEIEDTTLTNSEGDYIFKYSSGELVSLNQTEIDNHPNKLAKNEIASRQVKKNRGKVYREKSQQVMDIISDFNMESGLSAAQIDAQVVAHSNILSALQNNRPYTAKALIEAVTPDGTLITQELKDDVLAELNELP